MNISNIRVNYQNSCINVDSNSLIISWMVDTKQTEYQIIIRNKDTNIYDSNKINSSDNVIFISDLDLKMETEYTVTIKVWNEFDSCIKNKTFRTAIFGNFIGKWISNGEKLGNEIDYYKDNRNCILRKLFNISDDIIEAFLYIVGLGYYNVYINGRKVGKAELNTDWTRYSKCIYYDVYEVSKYLNKGKNIVSVELGNGWYNPSPLKLFGKYNLRSVLDIGEPKLIADLRIITNSNEKIIISTDESWEVSKGSYLFNNIYLGERFDSRLVNETWKDLNSVDITWENAVLTTSPGGKLNASFIDKIEPVKIVTAKSVTVNNKKNVLIDFGETIEGFIDISFNGKTGQEVKLIYGENINEDGTVDVDTTLAGAVGKIIGDFQIDGGDGAPKIAAQMDICILGDGKTHYVNKFTYHSFRYVEVQGIEKDNINDIKASYVHTNLEESGSFKCSNEFFNKLYNAAKNTKLNNIHSIFEDCARERLGYGGDIVCLATSQIFMFDTETLYEKVIKDFRYDIRENGGLPETAPYMGIQSNGTGDGAGPLGWQLVYSYIINKLYQYYGNVRIIESEYTHIKNQVEYLIGLGLEKLSKCCLGDWGSAEAKEGTYRKISPALEFSASCFYYYHIELLSKFAKIIGNIEDYRKYSEKAEEVKKLIINMYKNKDGTYSDRSQTSYAFALFFELDDEPEKLAKEFAEKIINDNYTITCGIFGMFMTYEVLTKYNYQNVIYKWLNKREERSFYSMLKDGQSVLSEHVHDWPAGADNHAMYTSYIQWFYEGLAGINILKDSFGADKIFIKPYFEEEIEFVECKYKSIKGVIESNWKRYKNNILISIKKPSNLKTCLLILDKKYKNCMQEYIIQKEDENFIYIDISSLDCDINIRLRE
ncbi:glycoside hydrolase family 78 protein [Clostridium sp. SYSU_GA19001]|uniref:family 78 glycoside hydrolase catalytic domain n=1 Tax=Clostridium caldaquaticum TaxID=2940653 RepID=UPI0020775E61|nr:family 78 glycoside hydrolase catalytic domain [Clostridium caldaquaticum]MCM8711534.1 glycoside hydrolase family 78 protein [Clostridium caldaquaticum]